MILPYRKRFPRIHPSVFVAPGAHVIGDVTVGQGSSIWFGSVLRADINRIRVGKNTNIQDLSVLHVDYDKPCILGDGIIVGHHAVVHGCRVEEGALVGIGSRILNGARVGAYSLIGAGAVVLEHARIPERSLVLGVPGKVVRRLTDEEAATHVPWAERYKKLADEYRKYLG